MRICNTGLNFFQVNNDLGDCRICAWTTDCYVGNLIDQSYEEIWNGKRACALRNRLINQDYSKCIIDNCPYLSKNEIDKHVVDIDDIPEYPEQLSLSYDNVCNYNCSTCDIHERYNAADKDQMQQRFDKIEEELKKVLPHVKEISANGQGELFASKRTLKMLSEWKPLAPAKECKVSLETNGSLFDEEHWKQIENLGQYNLSVSVTVMSFDEYTYQQLSGVRYPISRIENNLRFIKSLREKGIINYLELATVVQERNFRQLPDFTRRCIEEFGADEVRLRYFLPWGKYSADIEWFADVRNPYHPYNKEFLEIMKNPIFKHPKVNDWSGGRGSLLGEHPYKKKYDKALAKLKILDMYIHDRTQFAEKLKGAVSNDKPIVVYGVGEIGRLILNQLAGNYTDICALDRNAVMNAYQGIKISCPDCEKVSIDGCQVIITPIGDDNNIEMYLKQFGCPDQFIEIDSLFGETIKNT